MFDYEIKIEQIFIFLSTMQILSHKNEWFNSVIYNQSSSFFDYAWTMQTVNMLENFLKL